MKAPIMGFECAAIWYPVYLLCPQILVSSSDLRRLVPFSMKGSAVFDPNPSDCYTRSAVFCQPSLSAMPPLRISSPRDLNRIIPVQLSDLDELSILPKQSR